MSREQGWDPACLEVPRRSLGLVSGRVVSRGQTQSGSVLKHLRGILGDKNGEILSPGLLLPSGLTLGDCRL